MGEIETIIHCQVDQEPQAFGQSDIDETTISFAVNLSIDCRVARQGDIASDEQIARSEIEHFLTMVETSSIAIYRVEPQTRLTLYEHPHTEVRETDHLGSPTELLAWLDAQKTAVAKDEWRFWAPPPINDVETPISVAAAGAGDRLRSVQSWNAPVGQGLGLTRIVRVDKEIFVESGLVALPFLKGVAPPPEIDLATAPDPVATDPIDVTYEPGGVGKGTYVCRTTPAPRGTGPFDLAKFTAAELSSEGYLLANPHAADVHRMTRWFEERAASMLASAAALGPRDATPAELGRVERLCAFEPVESIGPGGEKLVDYRWDGAVWYGVSRLVAALDNLVIAIVQPPDAQREGDLLAPLVSLVLERLRHDVEPRLSEKQLQSEHITNAIRDEFRSLSPLAAAGPDKAVGLALLHAHGMAGPSEEKAAIVDDADLASELVRHFTTAPGGFVGARLKAYVAEALRTRVKVGEAVSRAVAEFEQRLNEESGAEAAVLRLLETVDLASANPPRPHTVFAERFIVLQGVGDDAVKAGIRLAFERAWIEYRGLLEGPFNGAEAVRRAAGNCFTRALLATFTSLPAMTATGLAEALAQSDYFVRRFLGTDANPKSFDPVLAALVIPAAGWRGALDAAVLGAHLSRSFADAIDPLEALTRPQRFVPDRFPRPLPVQIGSNIDGSKLDDFAKALNGIALAIRRVDTAAAPFGHAHLADLFWSWPPKAEPSLQVAAALHPMLPAVSDGRAPMFIEYEGYPFADALLDGRVVNNGNGEVDRTSPYYAPGPHTEPPGIRTFAALPILAYGRRYETFAYVTSNAGTLPLALQLERTDLSKVPWMPRPLGNAAPAGAVVVPLDYQRTTPIAEMAIAEPKGQPALFGRSIERVHPLAHDYPRAVVFATAGNAAHCDLFRSKGGFGEIPIPSNPPASTSQEVTLSDIRWAGQPKAIRVEIMDRLSDQPHVLSLMSEEEKARDQLVAGRAAPSFDIPVDSRASLTLTLRTIVPAAGSGALPGRFLIIDGHSHSLPDWLNDTCWLRLTVEAKNDADLCMSFAEVEGSAGASGGGPLILLHPEDPAWNKGLPTHQTVTVSTPRVTYLDFERWYANPDRSADLPPRLRNPLMLAYLLRHADERLAAMIDRLPDPAVRTVRIDFSTIDTLSADQPSATHKTVDLSGWLAAFAAGHPVPTPWTVETLVDLLEKLDQTFSFAIEFAAGAAFDLTGAGAGPYMAKTPAGTVARLSLHAHVPIGYFASAGHPSMFDARLLQYANVIDKDTLAAFPGLSLRMEVMADRIGELSAKGAEKAIALAEQMIATEPVERVRRYDLVTLDGIPAGAANLEAWQWRLLSEVDVTTQRWRPSGRPIYSYVRPKDHVDKPWLASHPAAIAWQLRIDDQLARFEHEAFFDRLHLDAHTLTQRLQPLPARTALQQFAWEAPSATYFRHRFTLRSRYAGALRNRESRECAAWPAETKVTAGKSDESSSSWASPWTRRVAMLADSSRILLTRPQLRALIPLTTAPDTDGRRQPAPPVAAILQEPPFAHGGLADRIAAEIKTGFGYGFVSKQPDPPQPAVPVEILDSRKEAGPTAHLTYRPLAAESALGMTLIAEGPMGLTFDAVNTPAPAFPNTMFTLRPTTWCGSEPPLEELMMGVAMRRYIDPAWTTSSVLEKDASGKLQLDPQRAWLIEITLAPGPQPGASGISVGTTNRQLTLLAVTRERGQVSARVSKRLVDGQDTTNLPVEVARFDSDRAAGIFVLHQPVAAGRYCAALLAAPSSADVGEGGSNLPVVLASFEWSLPKDMSGDAANGQGSPHVTALVIDGELEPKVSETAASAQTFLRWTRTGRDFDFIHVAARGNGAWTRALTEPVSGLAASVSGGVLSIGRGRAGNMIWPCSSTFTSEFPLHVHRHLAVITSHLLSELGRPVECYARSAASGLRQPSLVLPEGGMTSTEDACRIIEFETPAAILCDWTCKAVPDVYRTAYFDLLSTGFEPGNKGARLRLFFRFVGPFAHQATLKTLTLRLWTTGGPHQEFVLGVPAPADGIVGLYVTITKSSPATVPHFTFLSGAGKGLDPLTVKGVGAVGLEGATAERPGLYAQIERNPGQELWTDVSLLHTIGNVAGEPFDFDWLFSPTDGASPVESVNPSGLNKMVEAQARIVCVSPPIPIGKH
ncbi:hypothetical protein NKI86_03220 [Mesorhizobium sp. M0320]|uniref:hypothetical protein n=1 Tax=unclassified Mesorhizobium TaxID=325217 RepID=UPI0033372B51